MPVLRCTVVLNILVHCSLAMQNDSIGDAVDAMRRGDLAAAEQLLRAHPADADALAILGVVLDQEKKYPEAETAYRQALTLAPHSPSLLNNYGNHLLAIGKSKEARPIFLKVLAADPAHPNAFTQLARISLELHVPSEALGYLNHLPNAAPDALMLRMQALFALHRDREASALLPRLEALSSEAALGLALASVGQYQKAIDYFARALIKHPGDFTVEYNLGLSASHAGHPERAREVLQSALQQQPQNVDVLYDLAAVEAQLNAEEQALALLARASQLAPDRADVQRLLARTAGHLGYFGDSIQAWDRYAKLIPNDDEARRERAFAQTALGENTVRSIADLQWFTRKHTDDPLGHYELGTAEAATNPDHSLVELNRALTLKPDLVAAHVARGILKYRQGDFNAALTDFLYAAKRDPKNPAFQDRLGETDLALNRPNDALPVLREASTLAPRDSRILLHLGRALSATGHAEEASTTLARFRELGPDKSALPRPTGLVDFLSLAPPEQQARYRAGVERTVREQPNNADAQTRYLKILLTNREFDQAADVSRAISALHPSDALSIEAADALLSSEQYQTTQAFIESADDGQSLALDRAVATYHLSGAQAALPLLDRIPSVQRSGDFYLARSFMRSSPESNDDLTKALALHPTRADLYRTSALSLLRNHSLQAALRLLDQAAQRFPNEAEVLLLKAVALELTSNTHDSEHMLAQIADRWPEWTEVWKTRALILASQAKYNEAWPMIQNAINLSPGDVAIRTLALRIANGKRDFVAVKEQEQSYAYILSQKTANEPTSEMGAIESLFP